jgi:hypothetical protein
VEQTRRLAPLLVGAAMLLRPAFATAQPADEPIATFAYTAPAEKNYLRAILELESLSTISEVWYVIDVRQGGDPGYRWQMFQRKLSGTALGHDDNAFGTNFHGHGVGGNAYYLSARGNQLSIGESFGFAVAGALLWEYFGEIGEVVSVNDLIVTPFSGITIGEPFTQLSAYFDRQPATFTTRALGTAFGPLKSLNDALDGRVLRRSSTARDEWHRFSLGGSAQLAREELRQPQHSVIERSDFSLDFREQLARLRDYEGATEQSTWFDDGNLSDMSLHVAAGPRGLGDLAFATHVVPFGYFQRRAHFDASGLRGGGLVVGFEMGYRYLIHDYGDGLESTRDHSAFIQPAGARFEYRAALGGASLAARVDVAATYGGIHPIASRAYGDRSKLAPIIQHFDYYFGAGAQLESSLELRYAGLEADGSLVGRHFACVDEHVHLPISDAWQRFEFGLGAGVWPSWTLRLFATDTLRTGRLGAARGSAHESATGVELHANL